MSQATREPTGVSPVAPADRAPMYLTQAEMDFCLRLGRVMQELALDEIRIARELRAKEEERKGKKGKKRRAA